MPNSDIGLTKKLMFSSPLGVLCIHLHNQRLTNIFFDKRDCKNNSVEEASDHPACHQLASYFQHGLTHFDLPLLCQGTEFQKKVWAIINKIPYGKTITYGQIADSLGDKNKIRAVGQAVGANPVPIIVPCHRVVGANGTLTGYSGGLWRKKWLLKHENITLL